MADCRLLLEYPALERHRAEKRFESATRRRRLLIVAPLVVATAVAAFWIIPPLGMLVAGMGAMMVFFMALPGSSSVDAGALSGVEGEVAVLERLKALPDGYRLLNRVKLPDPTLPNGERELDFVVAGPSGLWVIEVKNTPGHIQVQPEARHWPLAKRAGCGSRPSWNAMDNPLHQVRDQVAALERWLLQQGHAVRARPIVVMAHPEVALDNVEAADIPILVRDQVADYIESQPKRSGAAAPAALLGHLRPGA